MEQQYSIPDFLTDPSETLLNKDEYQPFSYSKGQQISHMHISLPHRNQAGQQRQTQNHISRSSSSARNKSPDSFSAYLKDSAGIS